MFALGAVSLEQFVKRFNAGWLKYAVLTILILLGAVLAPLTLPVLPVDDLIVYSKSLGMTPSAGERSKLGVLPQYYADMFGWQNMAEQVAKVYKTLTSEEQKHCGILAMNYGEAGAIDFFGKDLGLPNATCGHNSYWHWGYDPARTDILIIIGGDKKDHLEVYSDVTEAGKITDKYAMPFENNLIIYICRGQKIDLKEVWPKLRFYI
jgi:hypothetical protein